MDEEKTGAGFGIHMRDYCAAHENFVSGGLAAEADFYALLQVHERKIGWLQHERLVHLIVMALISVLFFFLIWLYIVLESPLVIILIIIVLVLLIIYIRHYFFLENTVQAWYKLYDRIYTKLT